jgi:hypothetical protein
MSIRGYLSRDTTSRILVTHGMKAFVPLERCREETAAHESKEGNDRQNNARKPGQNNDKKTYLRTCKRGAVECIYVAKRVSVNSERT